MFSGRGHQMCYLQSRQVRHHRVCEGNCLTSSCSRCLGIEDTKGTLRSGAHADLVVMDKQGVILSTWIKGKKVWPATEIASV